jgi:AraC-like DNA-binding protein
VVLFGSPSSDDAEQMIRSFTVQIAPHTASHQSFVDAQRLRHIDESAFSLLQRFAREHLAETARKVTRLALVRPAGVPGAVVAGFYQTLDAPFPIGSFADASEALAWLGEAVPAGLDQAIAAAEGAPPLVGALRALLLAEVKDVHVDDVCRKLSVSRRTLERRLQQAGTSFARELDSVRIELAQRRLRESDDPMLRLAHELGFGSPQHFSRKFRLATGASPTAWRRRTRP